jgi:Kef-type K+ transport system membrane component KefB
VSVRALRNIAIIMLLALVVAFVPGGGNAADGILATLSVLFLVAIGATGYFAYRQNRFAYLSLPDRSRAVLLGSVGAIVLFVAGADRVVDWPGGVFILLAVLGVSIYAIFSVVMESRAT